MMVYMKKFMLGLKNIDSVGGRKFKVPNDNIMHTSLYMGFDLVLGIWIAV